jgi:hypothetical protein
MEWSLFWTVLAQGVLGLLFLLVVSVVFILLRSMYVFLIVIPQRDGASRKTKIQ